VTFPPLTVITLTAGISTVFSVAGISVPSGIVSGVVFVPRHTYSAIAVSPSSISRDVSALPSGNDLSCPSTNA
jgi:hypothetical protein